ncbi:4Fe-4S dicluster domain-containing protein [Deferribacter abyssi]|uniref:4Fe-4S dicluster domain-containing protein n=1 Tax=Deferribacter abyssi TaxID=213806 RepID=UPI003C2537C8
MSKNLICYDSISCIRCYACMINCAVENRARQFRDKNKRYELAVNETKESYYYLTPEIHEYGKYPKTQKITKFIHCNHCENAPCMQICPANAIEKRKNGAVVIHDEICVGCRSCMDACPYNIPKYDIKRNKTYKCIFCYDRVENGLKQACVEACPTGAMFSGTFEEVRREVLKRIEKYESTYNEPFVAYGLEEINNYVGSLGWITIVPKKELEVYKLSETPYKNGVVLRNIAKKSAPVLIGTAIAATAGHFLYWLAKRKKVVEQSSKEEE